MKIIAGGRGTGKTRDLLYQAKETGSTVVCANVGDTYRKVDGYGLTGLRCISYEDFLEEIHDSNLSYVIDDVSVFISRLSGSRVSALTLTLED